MANEEQTTTHVYITTETTHQQYTTEAIVVFPKQHNKLIQTLSYSNDH